jgi:RES domain-containing protein
MRVYRISIHTNLKGDGGLCASARWHSRGHRIVYCAPNPATALLETLIHMEIDIEDFPTTYQLITIDIPARVSRAPIREETLPPKWRQEVYKTRKLGNSWLVKQLTALLLRSYPGSIQNPQWRNQARAFAIFGSWSRSLA